MIVVGGTFEFDPAHRDAFIAGRYEMMRNSRAEPGCLEYVFSADPLDAGRVVLYERWDSQEALDAHLAAIRSSSAEGGGDDVIPRSASIVLYDVAGERPLG